MERSAEQELNASLRTGEQRCGRPGCICSLPLGERFVLWALRQWQHDGAIPRQGGAPLGALADQELVLRERGSITREVIEQAMATHNIQPRAIVEVETREGVREAVAAGFGIGAVFESEFGEDRRFGAIVVSDTDLAVAEYAVCLQERRRVALVRAFMDEAARLTP